VLQLHKAEGLEHAIVDLVRNFPGLLDQPISDVLFHGERVEKRAFLKYHPDFAAEREQFLLAHLRNLFVENDDAARVRT